MDQYHTSKITNQRYRPTYHIATPGGWLNDPNGLCYFNGYYHVFYQYHPFSAKWGPMHWGHVRSKDLVHWEQLPIALTLGDQEDPGGCFSGSAIVKDDRLYLLYTGQHYYADHDLNHFFEVQNLAYSDDGIHFTKYSGNPIITAPKDNSQDFRDPKVWFQDGYYYLVIGSRAKDKDQGRVLLYRSSNLTNWQEMGPIAEASSSKDEGYMWECPDLFNLNGQDVFMCSPMGMDKQKNQFLNYSQSCYSIGQLDLSKPQFTGSAFRDIDSGHNFYAPQTFLTPDHRRIMVGWMSTFEDEPKEDPDGWTGVLTLPRELKIISDHLYNYPVAEINNLHHDKVLDDVITVSKPQSLTLSDSQHLDLQFKFSADGIDQLTWQMTDQDGCLIQLIINQQNVTLIRRGSDPKRYAQLAGPLTELRILVDTSSVEIFLNQGWASFTERYYANGKVTHQLQSSQKQSIKVIAYSLG